MGRGIYDEAWEAFSAFNATNVKDFPLPPNYSPELAVAIDRLAAERTKLLDALDALPDGTPLADHLIGAEARDTELTALIISLQEELDWQMLAAYGLVSDKLPILGADAPPLALGQRAFEIVLARQVAAGKTETAWFDRHGSSAVDRIPSAWPVEYREVVQRRIELIESNPDIGLIERPEHKRRWNRTAWDDRQRSALNALVLHGLEDPELWASLRPRSTNELTDEIRRKPLLVEALEAVAEQKDVDITATVRRLVTDAAVPRLSAARLTDRGLRKRVIWEHVWELQRLEDRGQPVETIPMPPRYAQADFRSSVYWKYRGKLDVPNERFVLIPHGERGADASPVVGWAGWNERDLARASWPDNRATAGARRRRRAARPAARWRPRAAAVDPSVASRLRPAVRRAPRHVLRGLARRRARFAGRYA